MAAHNPVSEPPVVLNAKQAAPRLHPNLSARTLERWRLKGVGPAYVQIGRRVGYTEAALAEWLAQQQRLPQGR